MSERYRKALKTLRDRHHGHVRANLSQVYRGAGEAEKGSKYSFAEEKTIETVRLTGRDYAAPETLADGHRSEVHDQEARKCPCLAAAGGRGNPSP